MLLLPLILTLFRFGFLRVWGGERSDIVLLLWEVWHGMLQGFFQHRGSPSELSGMELPLSLLDHELYPDVVLRALSVMFSLSCLSAARICQGFP